MNPLKNNIPVFSSNSTYFKRICFLLIWWNDFYKMPNKCHNLVGIMSIIINILLQRCIFPPFQLYRSLLIRWTTLHLNVNVYSTKIKWVKFKENAEKCYQLKKWNWTKWYIFVRLKWCVLAKVICLCYINIEYLLS